MSKPNYRSLDDIFDEILGKLGDIVKLPLEQQMYRSDQVARALVDSGNKDGNYGCLKESLLCEDPMYEKWDQTSLGNNAYIAVMCKDVEIQLHAKKLVKGFVDWYTMKHPETSQ